MRMSRRLTLAICLLALAVTGNEVTAQGPPPQGMAPASMAPYPANSMYDFEYDKHYIRDGMWNRTASNRGRRTVFNIDLLTATRVPCPTRTWSCRFWNRIRTTWVTVVVVAAEARSKA